MRDIRFRGLNEETGEWVYGYYTKLIEGIRRFHAIITEDEEGQLTRYYIHHPETIGEYTGLKDKNGTEIYEGDILKLTQVKHYWIYKISTASEQFGQSLFAMLLEDNLSMSEDEEEWTYKKRVMKGVRDFIPSGKNCEIIGNIYENKELLND